MGIWCFLKLVIVYVLRYDFLDTFRLRVYKSKKSSFLPILERSIIVKFVMRYKVIHCSNETMYRGNRVWFG